MYTDCAFENTHPEDGGTWKSPGSLLNDLVGGAVDDIMGKLGKYEPWRGWPFRGVHPTPADPNGGLPPDASRTITKICCEKPMRKCITIGEPTVVVRALPIVIPDLAGDATRKVLWAARRWRPGCNLKDLETFL